MDIKYNFYQIIGISIIGIGILYSNFYYNNTVVKEYDKMYKIIFYASKLDKDIYNRKIDPKVVKKFCKIAKSKSINLDNITDQEFDIIYKTYTEYLINKYET